MGVYNDMAYDAGCKYGTDENKQMAAMIEEQERMAAMEAEQEGIEQERRAAEEAEKERDLTPGEE